MEFNSALEDNPELVNESPYEEGWIVKMEISNLDEISDLLDSKAYKSLNWSVIFEVIYLALHLILLFFIYLPFSSSNLKYYC